MINKLLPEFAAPIGVMEIYNKFQTKKSEEVHSHRSNIVVFDHSSQLFFAKKLYKTQET